MFEYAGVKVCDRPKRIMRWKGWLLKGKAPENIKQARQELAAARDTEKTRKEIAYLENNLERMRYGAFRQPEYFIGSGVVEAGCKAVLGQRMKCAGMFWSEEGGQGVLDLRRAFLSNRLDDFCQARATHHTPQNNFAKLAV